MPLTVLVPEQQGITALSVLPNVRPVLYDVDTAPPDGADDAEVLVPGFGSTDAAVRFMAQLPRLRLVQTLSAGIERWEGRLPIGVALSNCRGAHGGSTAEWAAAALLALVRDLGGFAADQAARRWNSRTTETLDGTRTLILGAGDLATELRNRLEPFGVEVTLVGRHARPGVQPLDAVPNLLASAEAVVVMLPLSDETRGLVDADFLARMRDGAILVNAGRGPLVDTDALLAELQSGRLRAALDVTDPEPLPPDHPLWAAPGLLLTPHVAGSTHGYQARAWSIVAAQIAQVADGRQPDNLVG